MVAMFESMYEEIHRRTKITDIAHSTDDFLNVAGSRWIEAVLCSDADCDNIERVGA